MISRLLLPSAMRLATPWGASVPAHPSEHENVKQRSVGFSVAYTKLKRWSSTVPEDVGRGAILQRRRANDASLLSLFGAVPGCRQQGGGRVGAHTPERDERGGAAWVTDRLSCSTRAVISSERFRWQGAGNRPIRQLSCGR
jgi:hypothetical protein